MSSKPGILLWGILLLFCAQSRAEAPLAESTLNVTGYARETLPGAATSAAYLSLRNDGEHRLQLLSVEVPGAENASAHLHTTIHTEGISRMRPLSALDIPAGEEVRMTSGGVHLMLRGVTLRAGEQLSLRLHFAGDRVLEITIPVRRLQARTHHHHG